MMAEGQEAMSLVEMIEVEDDTCRAFASEQENAGKQHFCSYASGNNLSLLPTTHCWRTKVVQWFYDVIDHLGENRELAYVAMNILDRFTNYRPLDERCYELQAMAALLLAVRIAGSRNLSLRQLILMNRENVCERDLIATGKAMISQLNWDHRLFTPADFVHVLIDKLSSRLLDHVKMDLLDTALYLAEIAVFDLILATKRPSVVGTAATLSALVQLESINAAMKVELCQIVKFSTARFGDIADLQYRMGLLSSETADEPSPHVILDDGEDDDM